MEKKGIYNDIKCILVVWKYCQILQKSNGDYYLNKNIKTEMLIPLEWACVDKRVNLKDMKVHTTNFKEEFS